MIAPNEDIRMWRLKDRFRGNLRNFLRGWKDTNLTNIADTGDGGVVMV